MRFEELQVGMSAERTRVVDDALVRRYADLTDDHNPVHVDEAAAAKSMFGARVAHGMLSGGFISAVIGMDLPGRGAIWLKQEMRFTRPVMIGDTITTRVEVLEVMPAKRRARLRTTCRNQRGETTLDGEALVQVMEDSG
ncbi:MAG: MaoC family dehydratase [Gemmatimonadetes bacterium]|nr:MaoC family dehydratase [Gemmatimonadota bacterium]